MIFSYIVCSAQMASVRTEPNQQATMSSQLLFGERAMVLSQQDDWLFIECEWDHYEGWVHSGSVATLSLKQYRKDSKVRCGLGSNQLKFDNKGHCIISPGSELFLLKSGTFPWLNEEKTRFKGSKLFIENIEKTEEWLQKCALSFLGTAYLWGGRSVLGIDCSGFSQIVYKLANIALPRDAADQALKGVDLGFLQEARCGDLAFFDDAEGNINHVGILLNNHTIIHSSQQGGGVVIDAIDQGGIISKKHKRRVAKLRIVKRYL